MIYLSKLINKLLHNEKDQKLQRTISIKKQSIIHREPSGVVRLIDLCFISSHLVYLLTCYIMNQKTFQETEELKQEVYSQELYIDNLEDLQEEYSFDILFINR